MARTKEDFTTGNISRMLIKFCGPFLLSNLLQALYGAADLAIVGQFCQTTSTAGVTIGSQITHVATMMVSGLTVGGTILVAQYFSARREKDISETIGTMFTLLFILALIITGLSIGFCDQILNLLQTPANAMAEARSYTNICMAGTILIFGYNAISAVQRGLGDSIHPLIFVGVACAVNIILDLVLVAGVGMGASGAAVATVAAQGISFLLAAAYLRKSDFPFDFKPKSFKLVGNKVKNLVNLGLPSSVQSVVVNFSFLLMTAIVNGFNSEAATSAVGFVSKFNSFAILPTVAMSSSISAIAAQNITANELGRAKETFVRGLQIALAISAVIFCISQFASEWVLRLFSPDAEVLEWGVPYLKMYSYEYLLVPFVFCMNGLISASGHTMYSMLTAVASSIALRMPAAILLSKFMGLAGVGLAAPLATCCSIVMCAIFVGTGRWKNNKTGIQRQ